MNNYDYYEAVKEDIKEYITENYEKEEISNLSYNDLYDELFTEDSITGNTSGSYTYSTYKARENVCDNEELLNETISEFSIDMNEHWNDWEYLDVSIRCYLLGQVLQEALDELESEAL